MKNIPKAGEGLAGERLHRRTLFGGDVGCSRKRPRLLPGAPGGLSGAPPCVESAVADVSDGAVAALAGGFILEVDLGSAGREGLRVGAHWRASDLAARLALRHPGVFATSRHVDVRVRARSGPAPGACADDGACDSTRDSTPDSSQVFLAGEAGEAGEMGGACGEARRVSHEEGGFLVAWRTLAPSELLAGLDRDEPLRCRPRCPAPH